VVDPASCLEAIVADETIEVWRIYTGEDGKSRMEPIGVPLSPGHSEGLLTQLFQDHGEVGQDLADHPHLVPSSDD
jgi:hypothetical protein